jgi:transcriptional regulator with XRE-family HTH domain
MNKLKQTREAAGITQTELAKASGISVRVLQNYEQGTRPLNGARAITVYQIAKALNCTVEDLLEL